MVCAIFNGSLAVFGICYPIDSLPSQIIQGILLDSPSHGGHIGDGCLFFDSPGANAVLFVWKGRTFLNSWEILLGIHCLADIELLSKFLQSLVEALLPYTLLIHV